MPLITRPAIANERLTLNRAGEVVLQLKSPYHDGTTHIVMSPIEFLQRLAALVPRPRLHLIRFHGVLAPNAKVRPAIIPSASSDANPAAPDQAESPHSSPLARMKRLTLILMTALAAGLALVPLTLRGGEPGSEIQTPMAIVILFGLLSSTALNMIVVPALYLRFGSALRVKEQRSAVRTVTA